MDCEMSLFTFCILPQLVRLEVNKLETGSYNLIQIITDATIKVFR